MGLDPVFELVEDGPHREIALEILEGLFDLHELDVVAPPLRRIGACEVGTQEITSLSAAHVAQRKW